MVEWEKLDSGDNFRAVVANPPYQREISAASQGNEATVVPIFHEFQKTADVLPAKTCFIYPGERWVLQSGKGLADFGKAQINSPALKYLLFFPYSHSVFSGARMADGLTVVLKDNLANNNGIFQLSHWGRDDEIITGEVLAPGDDLITLDPRVNNILTRIKPLARTANVGQRKYAQKAFGIESNFAELNPGKITSSEKPGLVRLITNDKAGKAGRAATFWIERKHIPRNHELIDKWKVIASSMNLTGINGRCPGIQILPPGTAVGRVKLILAAFDSETEAINYFRYISSDFGRFMLASSGDTQTNFGLNLPDLGDYSQNNSVIDFASPLEHQLQKHFAISDDENIFMAEWVDNYLAGSSLYSYDEASGKLTLGAFVRAKVQTRSH